MRLNELLNEVNALRLTSDDCITVRVINKDGTNKYFDNWGCLIKKDITNYFTDNTVDYKLTCYSYMNHGAYRTPTQLQVNIF